MLILYGMSIPFFTIFICYFPITISCITCAGSNNICIG